MSVEPSPLKRRLTVVLLVDVVGYSRLMSVDEEGTYGRVAGHVKELIDPTVAEYGGRLVKSMGDGMLVEFGSALDAVRCGLDIQQRLAEWQRDIQDGQIQLRIGINTGDVIVDDRDMYGHSINVTARLESIARPGSVSVSQSIYDQTRSQPGLRFIDKGLHQVKNIDYPIRVFEVGYGQAVPVGRRRLPRKYASVAGVTLVGIATLGFFVIGDHNSNLPNSNLPENSIIVLPFRNLSNNTEDDYFADAITDDLTTDLSRLPQSFVIASATAMIYKGRPVDARVIGRDYGVRYLLEGSIRRSGGTVQINAQLIDTHTGVGVWADRFTHESTTLQHLEEAVTGRIGASLNVHPAKAMVHTTIGSFAPDHNPLDERLRAMALVIGLPTPANYLAARAHAEECLKGDPASAECWALLARVLMGEYLSGWNNVGPEGVKKAEEAYQHALAIDPSNAGAHLAAGNVHHVRGDYLGALAAFDQAIVLDPNFTVAHAQKSRELLYLGRSSEAATALNKAISLSPDDPFIGFFHWGLGRIFFAEGNYKEAAVWLEKSVEEKPNVWYNRAWLISANALIGRNSEASVYLEDFRKKFPAYTLPKIQKIYEEPEYKNNAITTAYAQLFRGLAQAGLN